jgi:hypothetical protein
MTKSWSKQEYKVRLVPCPRCESIYGKKRYSCTRWSWVVIFTLRPIDPGKSRVPHWIGGWVGPRPGLDVWRKCGAWCAQKAGCQHRRFRILPGTLLLLRHSQNLTPVRSQVLLETVTLGYPLPDFARCLAELFRLHQYNPICYEMNQNA